MPYVRYPRAAAATATPREIVKTTRQSPEPQGSSAHQVLWASAAMPVRDGGRLVGVRRQGSSDVEVAWVERGRVCIQWVPARLLLTEEEARQWLKLARFSR